MSEILKYLLLLIFLLVVFALVWILRDGINVRNGGGFSLAWKSPAVNRIETTGGRFEDAGEREPLS